MAHGLGTVPKRSTGITEDSCVLAEILDASLEQERPFEPFTDMIGTVESTPDSTVPVEDRRFSGC